MRSERQLREPEARRKGGLAWVAAASGLLAIACGDAPQATVGSNGPPLSFEAFRSTVYQEPESGIFVVNGDEPVTSEQGLEAFYHRLYPAGEGLIVHQWGGVDARWDDTQKLDISYCVSDSFGGFYDQVVDAMAAAAGAWEAGADVRF